MASSYCSSVCKLNESWCNTKIQLHKVKYVWIIDDFNFHEAIGNALQSPTFSSVTDDQVKWYLRIKPNGKTDTKDTISFYVYLSPDSVPKRIFAKYSASVLNSESEEVIITNSEKVKEFGLKVNSWGRNEFFEKTAENRRTFLANNKLTIICTITFSPINYTNEAFRINNTCHRCNVQFYPEMPACNIVENLGMLLENHKFSDIVISVKNKEYPAHKTILAARSSVFAAMLEHDFKEKDTNRIEIEDMNEEVVAEMLQYIYTGKCKNSETLADGLLAAADKYDLIRLKMICAESLYKSLSVDNAANILALADLHHVEELKSEVIKFIVARFAAVLNTVAWKNVFVSHPELINEVCRAVAGQLPAPKEAI